MTVVLIRKLLRDVRLPLLVVGLLLAGFECLWAKITQRLTEEILPSITQHLPLDFLLKILFEGPGKLLQTLMGGETINITRTLDVLTIGYVHPLAQIILGVWAVGRAASAIAGEIDRGTMELLLAQPLARGKVVLAHLGVDCLVIPLLCLCLWAGNWLGLSVFGRIDWQATPDVRVLHLNPLALAPALVNVAALVFALSGYTTWLSARGRFRGQVLGLAVLVTLLQFLVNVVGQMWDAAAFLRPFTVFYYYQPQQIILDHRWTVDLATVWHGEHPFHVHVIAVLVGVGTLGYGLAWWTFSRRDLPAPL